MASPFKADDIYLFRTRKMHEYASTKVFHKVFSKGTERRLHSISLFDYYESKGIPIKKFRNTLNTDQIKYIDDDPDGDTFDITLLFRCIQWGCDGVANKNDDKWKEGNDSLESRLTTVKNLRNNVSHQVPQYTSQQFVDQTEEIRRLLTDILRFAGNRYNILTAAVDQLIKDMDADINFIRDRSLIPLVYDDYKKQSLILEKGNKVRGEGKLYLGKVYDGWDSITPASLILNLEFKVKSIFTAMVLLEESNPGVEIKQDFEDLLTNINYDVSDPVILIEGIAGVGKTTLTKKILSDWFLGQSIVNSLTSYDLLLYAECRNRSIKSFKELIMSLMPKLARCFEDDDFKRVVLDQKIILLIDGLDEINTSSSTLFREMLELKKNYGVTLIATTRPEKVVTYYHLVQPLQIKTKHIKLIGITKGKINEFVSKYVGEMKTQSLSTPDINILLNYLKKTELQLSDLWMLPYNLILLIILWINDSSAAFSITTAPELYWKIHEMICGKLMCRLLSNDATKHLEETVLEKKINVFISSLGKEALLGLKNDQMNLPAEANKRLKDTCANENIPSEEMTGAFLKTVVMRTPRGINKSYSFPHKGSQEFQGALDMFNDIVSKFQGIDAMKAEADVNHYLNLPESLKEKLVRLIQDESDKDSQSAATSSSTSVQTSPHDTTVIMDMLTNLHVSPPSDIRKYQNLLIILLGMFHLGSHNIQDSTKMEALELLKKTGVVDRTDWIRILNSVKCDEFVATFISRQPGVLKAQISITDFSVFAYTSLLKTMKSSPEGTGSVNFQLNIEGDGNGLYDLLELIINHQFKVSSILINDENYTKYNSVLKSLPSPLKDVQEVDIDIHIREETSDLRELMEHFHKKEYNVHTLNIYYDFRHMKLTTMLEDEIKYSFRRGTVIRYMGALLPGMEIPPNMKRLCVSINDKQAYLLLQSYLQQKRKKLKLLCISINPRIDLSILGPLPDVLVAPSLWFPTLDCNKAVDNASEIMKRLQPTDGKKKFRVISFPHLSQEKKSIIEAFSRGVEVEQVWFPLIPATSEMEKQEITRHAKVSWGCNVEWKDAEKIWQYEG